MVITAAVIGDRETVWLHTIALARYVPGVSHVAVAVPGAAGPAPLGSRAGDELDLRGIELTSAASGAAAVVGANLVVVTAAAPVAGPDADPGAPIHLAKGALLVNASGRDLPGTLLAEVTTVFVDDRRLVNTAAEQGLSRPKSADGHPRHRIFADLRQVLLGEHPGRTGSDQVLLIELLSLAAPL